MNPIRVAYFLRKPHFYIDKNEEFVGDDKTVFVLFAYFLNASLDIRIFSNMSDLPNDVVVAIKEGHVDIMGNRLTQVFYIKNVDYSFPIGRDDKYFVVPKPQMISTDLLIVFMFTQTVWLAILITVFVLTILMYTVYRKSSNSSFLVVWGVLLSMSLAIFQTKTRFRYVLIMWICGSYILSSSFQANLIRSFVNTRYKNGIKTLDDLKASGLKIGLEKYFIDTSNATKDLCVKEQYIQMWETKIVERILRGDTSRAYFLGKDLSEHLIEECIYKNCGSRSFEMMPQTISSGVTVYHLRKKSFFTAKLDRFIILLHSSGLLKSRKPQNEYIPEKEKALRMPHFSAAFRALVVGYIVSMLVFTLELIIRNYGK
ncbi:unnamed protein product [Acanthoscelides obtectus]|uniref:Ionotropic glutamate receptor C-terminal domain-containing protein n=1 Tax=Acanthoscelides obtectus TaxID=200917 RepID=A0A9P0P9F1_ACAOB|nr:unnamed protein product [Acanthoscelides obtectus]CAK1669370.1 hypothetical protein AOBTE_LOCUS26974 [Acanthoscelides obtectus]